MIYVMLAVTLLLAAAVFGLVKKLREKNQMLEQQMKDRKKMQRNRFSWNMMKSGTLQIAFICMQRSLRKRHDLRN